MKRRPNPRSKGVNFREGMIVPSTGPSQNRETPKEQDDIVKATKVVNDSHLQSLPCQTRIGTGAPIMKRRPHLLRERRNSSSIGRNLIQRQGRTPH
ncbi:unnamed protein product [Discosporangium mesarthrocarpum]